HPRVLAVGARSPRGFPVPPVALDFPRPRPWRSGRRFRTGLMLGAEQLRVTVIIPAYRAAGTIEKVLHGIPGWVDSIIVVDDASPDETGTRVRAVADPRVRLLVHEVNRGAGGAMVTGYRQALLDGSDICVKMDADDQMDPAHLPALIEPLVS